MKVDADVADVAQCCIHRPEELSPEPGVPHSHCTALTLGETSEDAGAVLREAKRDALGKLVGVGGASEEQPPIHDVQLARLRRHIRLARACGAGTFACRLRGQPRRSTAATKGSAEGGARSLAQAHSLALGLCPELHRCADARQPNRPPPSLRIVRVPALEPTEVKQRLLPEHVPAREQHGIVSKPARGFFDPFEAHSTCDAEQV